MAARTGIDGGLNKRVSNAYHDCKRRAREAGQALDFGLEDLRALVLHKLRGGRCLYCGVPIDGMNWSLDHCQPVCRGGSFAMDNVVICCQACNTVKGVLSGTEYFDLLCLIRGWTDMARKSVIARLKAGAKLTRR